MVKILRTGTQDVIKINSQKILDSNMEYLTFPELEKYEEISHLFTTRIGGVSEGYLSELNMSYSRGDEKENVDRNYNRVARVLNSKFEDFVCTMQTHTTNILRVNHSHRGSGVANELKYQDIDGLITNEPQIVLTALFADCVPLYFYDPIHHAIGLAHSGWKGTLNQIGLKMIQSMKKEFESKPEDIIAAIGPSICADCYEIGNDVAEQFIFLFQNMGFEKAKEYEQYIKIGENEKYHLDLWKTNELILRKAGLLKENISTTDLCTCCNSDYLFSHRASNGKRGNLAAFLKLN